ncbi:MAG: hypothetical protein KF886_19280 [Candidatus Hydrogenedentes bacterium]|nr:hypothetical protein [Candidatus Hydrogenedentota bacterium]
MAAPTATLIAQLQTAIAGWRTEVGSAQAGLARKIDGANAQLRRLLEVLRQRDSSAADLARANEELDRLRHVVQEQGMPPGAVTRYAAETAPPEEDAAREFSGALGQIETAVHAWTAQVTQHQSDISARFDRANGQLRRLVELLLPEGTVESSAPEDSGELDRLRHENEVLSSEVGALNRELEAMHQQREAFASANLAAEGARERKQREEFEAAQARLREREAEMQAISRERDALKDALARLESSAEAMREALALHREEAGEQRSAINALGAEIAALREALAATPRAGSTITETADGAAGDDDHAGLREALAGLERELETLRRREAETVASARALLGELETHRNFETAQEQALAEARAEAARLQDALNAAAGRASNAESERDAALERAAALETELAARRPEDSRDADESGDGGPGAGHEAAARALRMQQQDILVSALLRPESNRGLGDILVASGILTRDQLVEALATQESEPSQLLGAILVERGFATEDAIAQAVACQLGQPVVDPADLHIPRDAIAALSKDVCAWYVCVPLRVSEDRMVVAMANPLDESTIQTLREESQREIIPVVGTPARILDAIAACYGAF